jgi:uncharacterized RDD family membrane protein YckC
MSANTLALPIDELNEEMYGDFGSRLCAILLDLVFLAPLGIVEYFLDSFGKNFHLCTILLNFMFFIWYRIYLVKKYGGTPGKLLSGIKIIKLNWQPIGWKEAFLRESVVVSLTIITNIVIVYAIAKADNSHYLSLTWTKKSHYLTSFYPLFFRVTSWMFNIWTWGELVVLLTNKKKRALHDFIAGTLVVKIKYLNNANAVISEPE